VNTNSLSAQHPLDSNFGKNRSFISKFMAFGTKLEQLKLSQISQYIAKNFLKKFPSCCRSSQARASSMAGSRRLSPCLAHSCKQRRPHFSSSSLPPLLASTITPSCRFALPQPESLAESYTRSFRNLSLAPSSSFPCRGDESSLSSSSPTSHRYPRRLLS
jgi:hypothetical protein